MRNQKKYYIGAALLVLAMLALLFLLVPPTSRVEVTPAISVTVSRPNLLQRFREPYGPLFSTGLVSTVTVYVNDSSVGTMQLFDSLVLERPLAFLPGRTPNELLCIYDHDVRVDVIAFDLNSPTHHLATNHPLRYIIRAPAWKAERLLNVEMNPAVRQIQLMSDAEFKSRSVPLKAFPFYLYVSRDHMLKVLKEEAEE